MGHRRAPRLRGRHLAFVDQARPGRRQRSVLPAHERPRTPPRAASTTARSEVEAADAELVEADVVGELVAHGARDLVAQQVGVVAEVAAQRVAEDHDAVVGVVARGPVALVEAVGPARADRRRRSRRRRATARCAAGRAGRRARLGRALRSRVVERVELHELAFLGAARRALRGRATRSGARSLRTRSRTRGRASRPSAPRRRRRLPSARPRRSRRAPTSSSARTTPIELKPWPTTITTRPSDSAISAASADAPELV